MDIQFRANGSQVTRLRTKSDLAEFSDVSDVSALWAQSGAAAAAPNPTSLAPGPPWRHFDPPLVPWGLRGAIGRTLGSQRELGMTLGPKWTSNSEQMALK